jgi:hypothetical protein
MYLFETYVIPLFRITFPTTPYVLRKLSLYLNTLLCDMCAGFQNHSTIVTYYWLHHWFVLLDINLSSLNLFRASEIFFYFL